MQVRCADRVENIERDDSFKLLIHLLMHISTKSFGVYSLGSLLCPNHPKEIVSCGHSNEEVEDTLRKSIKKVTASKIV